MQKGQPAGKLAQYITLLCKRRNRSPLSTRRRGKLLPETHGFSHTGVEEPDSSRAFAMHSHEFTCIRKGGRGLLKTRQGRCTVGTRSPHRSGGLCWCFAVLVWVLESELEYPQSRRVTHRAWGIPVASEGWEGGSVKPVEPPRRDTGDSSRCLQRVASRNDTCHAVILNQIYNT